MWTVTLSSRNQIAIPRAIREALDLIPGQKVQVMVHEGRIELIPLRRLKDMRGFLAGIDTSVDRDRHRV